MIPRRLQWLWPLFYRFGPFGGLAIVMWYLCRYRVDADFGWHVRSGEYIAAHGIPSHDIFTYTAADYPWVNHEWLNDLLVYLVGSGLGYGALVLGFVAMWVAAVGTATRWRLSLAVAGVSLAALFPYLGVRPVAWTVLLLAVTLRLIMARRLVWLPLVFAVWANLHGGFVVGLAVLGLYAAMERSWVAARWLSISVAASLLNPYGWRLYQEIWQTATDQRLHSTIVEWAPLAIDQYAAPYLIAVIAALLLWPGSRRWSRVLGVGLLLATLSATRQLPLLVIATVGHGQAAYEALLAWAGQVNLRPRWWRLGLATIGVAAGLMPWWWPATVASPGAAPPYRSVAELREHPCRGALFNHYSFGGYLIWRLPGQKVYIDGRMPSWSDSEGRYLDRWQRVLKDTSYADAEFSRFNVRCVLISQSDHQLSGHLQQTGWHRAVEEADAVLWRRD